MRSAPPPRPNGLFSQCTHRATWAWLLLALLAQRQQLPPTLLLLCSFSHGRTCAQVQCDDRPGSAHGPTWGAEPPLVAIRAEFRVCVTAILGPITGAPPKRVTLGSVRDLWCSPTVSSFSTIELW